MGQLFDANVLCEIYDVSSANSFHYAMLNNCFNFYWSIKKNISHGICLFQYIYYILLLNMV